ncbi:hypothetical protein AMTR_s00136p00117780 [Amborella trichopoda]|uniref:Aminotransferase-like plant mobile domain-containing protein n=1 Tax=Amborella trichopoda TaxID=13333 RepID=W1NFQ2_AMBTC|nr:hypothetical protein AMTR_s00136p00117780 [Amborella trichopoda]
MPRACKWKKHPRCKDLLTAFEDISIDMVNWQPYEEYTPLDMLSKENALYRLYLINFHPTSWVDELASEISDWRQRECNVVKATTDKCGGMSTKDYIA